MTTTRIYKYTLESDDSIIDMPRGSGPLSVGVQDNAIVVWVEVSPERPTTGRRFTPVNTGDEKPLEGVYIGTVTMDNGIVWHVYDRGQMP